MKIHGLKVKIITNNKIYDNVTRNRYRGQLKQGYLVDFVVKIINTNLFTNPSTNFKNFSGIKRLRTVIETNLIRSKSTSTQRIKMTR